MRVHLAMGVKDKILNIVSIVAFWIIFKFYI